MNDIFDITSAETVQMHDLDDILNYFQGLQTKGNEGEHFYFVQEQVMEQVYFYFHIFQLQSII